MNGKSCILCGHAFENDMDERLHECEGLVSAPPTSSPRKVRDPRNEIVIFSIGLGLLLGYLGYSTIHNLSSSAPELLGMPRKLALGIPIIACAFLHSVAGLFLLITRSAPAVVTCVIASFLTAGFYLVFELCLIGLFQGKLISFVVYAIPCVTLMRGIKALDFIKSQR